MSEDSFTTQRARLGAFSLHAQRDPRETTRAAREAEAGRYRRQVVEAAEAKGEELTEAEITRRAAYLRRAHFQRMAMKSAQVRRARKAGAT
jgi:hypothetical protein